MTRTYKFTLDVKINIEDDGRRTIVSAKGMKSKYSQFGSSAQWGGRIIAPGSLVIDAYEIEFVPEKINR